MQGGREGSWGWGEATGSSHPIAFGRVERQIWQYERAHATAGFDDYTLRRPYKHADRRWKEPTPPPHLRSQVQYRHNRNKAESLSTLEVH